MSNPISRFWQELRRRKVIRVAVAYAVVAWILIEVSSVIFPALLLPEWSGRLVIALAALGFPAALIMAWVFELSPEGLKRELPAPSVSQALALTPDCACEPAAGCAMAPPDSRKSIVVLPFTNLSTEEGSGFFSDGITEEILSLLAKQPDLRVVSRTTSFSFKDSKASIQDIASRLNVGLVLEGSVRRADRQLRIMAQLIDPATDGQLWSERYDRELTDVFAVQGDIARRIVNALQLDPNCCPECEPPTRKIEAYDYYLRGRQYYHQLTENSLGFARQMFQHAIAIDPGFARAYAGLADTESMIAAWFSADPQHLGAADQASLKALQLEPDLADAHSARGHALTLNGDFEAAARQFEQALEREPGNYDALYLFGRSRFAEGKIREAADLWGRAHAAQPDEFQAVCLQEGALRGLGDQPDYAAVLAEAVRVTEQRLDLNPDDQRALHLASGVFISAGRTEQALALVNRLLELSPDDGAALYNAACTYARAGYQDQALKVLEKRLGAGQINRAWVENDADMKDLREHPRFRELLDGLAAQSPLQ